MGSTSEITILTFGIDLIVDIEELAVKNGIGLIEEMLIGVPTKSKTETFPKIGATLGGIHIEISTIELTGIEVDAVNAEVDKIVELLDTLTVHDDVGAVRANSVAKEVTGSSVDEVLGTSIEYT